MIDLIDVSKSYGPGLPAVNHANLHIDKGEFVFVVGNSGSGKTTLIKKLLGDALKGQQVVLIENEFGEIGIDGEMCIRDRISNLSLFSYHCTPSHVFDRSRVQKSSCKRACISFLSLVS